MNRLSKKIFAALITAILLLTLMVPFSTSASTTTSVSFNNTYDYFGDKYPSLAGKTNVFKTAEMYQFSQYFLGNTVLASYYPSSIGVNDNIYQPSSGDYVFLLGGAWDPAMQASISDINDVAKAYGITSVYNFDPHLDGKATSVVDISTNATYATKYGQILTKLGLTADQLKFPSVIVYKKTAVDTGTVVSNYSWTASTYSDAALKAELDKAAVSGKIANINVSDSDYVKNVIDARYFGLYGYTSSGTAPNITYTANPSYKSSIRPFDLTKDCRFEVVTLDELRGILASSGNYAVLLGGLWCHNTMAAMHMIEPYAEQYNISKVYVYDTVLDSISSSTSTLDSLQTRSSKIGPTGGVVASPISGLYTSLINDYLPNIYTLNQGEYDQVISAYSQAKLAAPSKFSTTTPSWTSPIASKIIQKFTDNTFSADTDSSRRAQLPNFFVYNKDHKDASGNPAPVINQVEIMTEQWFANDASGNDANGTPYFNNDTANENGNAPYYDATGAKVGSSTTPIPVYDNFTKGYTRTLPPISITSGTTTDGLTTYTTAAPFTSSTYSYWAPGLNQVLGQFEGLQLSDLISKVKALNSANYTAASYSAVTTALQAANTVKASIDAAVTAKSASTTAPAGSAIANAYIALDQASSNLVAASSNTTSLTSPTSSTNSTNPHTGNMGSAEIFIIAGISLFSLAGIYSFSAGRKRRKVK